MNIPRIDNIKEAVSIYYSHSELGITEIQQLFNCCRSKASLLKRFASQHIADLGVMPRSDRYVDTQLSFEAWGIDVGDMEKRLKRLKELKEYIKG